MRTICATNRDIESLVANGEFREDLYYRLNVGVIRLKPLSQRPEAIPVLANFFLKRQSERLGKPFQVVHAKAMAKLLKHHWPGNVRELRNVIDQAVVLNAGRVLHPEHIDLSYAAERRGNQGPCPAIPTWFTPGALLLPESPFDLERVVDEIVRKALCKNGDNKSRTARYLGLSRSKLLTLLSHAETTAGTA